MIDSAPTCSPDGQWITFVSTRSGKSCLWKVSTEGGEPVQLTDTNSMRASFSPDGKMISCGYFVEGAKPPWKVAIIPFAGGQPVKLIEIPQSADGGVGFWWTSDGRALIYADTQKGQPNLWSLPIDGGKPAPITNLPSETMTALAAFAPSRDGKRMALARGYSTGDIVLIKGFK